MALRRESDESLTAEVGRRLGGSGSVTVAGVEAALDDVLATRRLSWRAEVKRTAAVAIADELGGLGPIGPLLRDASVSEVMINASGEVFVERDGLIERTAVRFANQSDVRHLIERVVSPLGLRADASSPWVDARL